MLDIIVKMAFFLLCYSIWLPCQISYLNWRLHLIIWHLHLSISRAPQTQHALDWTSFPASVYLVKNSHNTSSCIRAMSQIYPWNLLRPHSSCCFYHRVLLILCSSPAVHLPWQHLSPGRLQVLINQCLCIYLASYNLLSHFIQSDLLKIQFCSHVYSLHYLHLF